MRDYVTGEVFAVVQCGSCGFARTDPTPADIGPYYQQRYRRFNALTVSVLRRLYARRVDGWRAHLPAPGVALEVGAGSGWMLRALRDAGWRAFGSERSVGAAVVARASGAPVFVGDLGAVREAPVVDLVVMFHVLEHLADPLAALRAVAMRLRPGGTVILGLPNIASWQSGVTGPHWRHLDVPRHLCHFTPASIERALAASGLRMTRLDFRSFEHDPFGWVQSVLDLLGFEQGILLKVLEGDPRRSGRLAALAAVALSLPLGALGMLVALASWAFRRGAVMEVFAVREDG